MNARIQVLNELNCMNEINSSIGEKLVQVSRDRKALKIQAILERGEEMNTSELSYLLGVGVHHQTIRKALNMPLNAYKQMIKPFVTKPHKNGNGKGRKSIISIDDYVHLFRQGLETSVIAKRLGLSSKQLSEWKKHHKEKIDHVLSKDAI